MSSVVYRSTGRFSFKKLSDFTPFLDDPVRLETAPTGPGASKTSKKTEN